MKVLFVTDGILTPASRFRCSQFFEVFEEHGVECELRYAYGPGYNKAINRWYALPYKTGSRLKRAYHQLFFSNDTDILFLQRNAFPHSGLIEEILAGEGVPTIFDFDDSLFVNGAGETVPRRKVAFERAVDVSDHLIAGNRYLSETAGRSEKTTVIPTVIDTSKYVPRLAPKSAEKVIVGWMGTAGNFPFLSTIVPDLKRLLESYPEVVVRIVSNSVFEPLKGVSRVQQIEWTAETELDWLQSFDIGLMPLVDSPLTRGKCAFKMIQYMAVGVPVVVSPVGANVEVFEGDTTIGFMPQGEWFDALANLVEDSRLREKAGENGRKKAVAEYSIDAVLPRYLGIFEAFGR